MSNRYPPPPRIDGGCITKEYRTGIGGSQRAGMYHYHTKPMTPLVKEWYLDHQWIVASGFCQLRNKPSQQQDPYDWQFDD